MGRFVSLREGEREARISKMKTGRKRVVSA
ncbi:hypothetical protein GGD46_003205 [Rhizobium lusitanum]|uniref:Uncharacterized protein n=1 Tax=Rhizobium lusitanum TaxID=293958 RepID=A0A7X0IUI1_9HYPH|nr:hypothetical protein [Rhizobium lusitanum]